MKYWRFVIIFLVVVQFIGGLNWFVTALRNMSDNTETYDIFNDWMDQKWVNWIYITVFILSLLLLVVTLFPHTLNAK